MLFRSEILAYGFSLGDVDAVTIENLDAQSAERATGHEAFKSLSPARVSAENSRPHGAQESPPMPSRGGARGGVSVVAVAAGEGLAAIMTSAGATEIVAAKRLLSPFQGPTLSLPVNRGLRASRLPPATRCRPSGPDLDYFTPSRVRL